MLTLQQLESIFQQECSYRTSRSGGKGGQNVNKVESKVELEFDIAASQQLSESQKHTLFQSTSVQAQAGIIKLVSETHRTQLQNKKEVQQKLRKLLDALLKPKKKRIKTKPGKAAKEKKLQNKKRHSEKKRLRRGLDE